jgi:hypothetical protein
MDPMKVKNPEKGTYKTRGKTTISNAGILKRVFRKPPGAHGRVRVNSRTLAAVA